MVGDRPVDAAGPVDRERSTGPWTGGTGPQRHTAPAVDPYQGGSELLTSNLRTALRVGFPAPCLSTG